MLHNLDYNSVITAAQRGAELVIWTTYMSSDKNIILAIDTALFGCAAAVYDRARDVCFADARAMPRGQAEHLVPMVMDVLSQSGHGFDVLDAVVTTIGPGAFTGLRIGLSTAKAFGLALDIPVYGITTLTVAAHQFVQSGLCDAPFSVIFETKRRDFYMQNFDAHGRPQAAPIAHRAHDVNAHAHPILIGDAPARFLAEITSDTDSDTDVIKPRVDYTHIQGFETINPETLARLYADAPALFTQNPAPLYLRPPDVSASKKKQRILKAY